MTIVRRRPLLAATLLAVGLGCISSEVDPRCTISTNSSSRDYQDVVAQCINDILTPRSKLLRFGPEKSAFRSHEENGRHYRPPSKTVANDG